MPGHSEVQGLHTEIQKEAVHSSTLLSLFSIAETDPIHTNNIIHIIINNKICNFFKFIIFYPPFETFIIDVIFTIYQIMNQIKLLKILLKKAYPLKYRKSR